MTKDETQKVKLAAKSLLQRLISGKPKVLVEDWYKDSQTQARMRSAVEEILDKTLPESYDKDLFQKKRDNVYELIYEYSMRKEKWAA
jgi:type I restriction enzyme R subunit